MQLPNLVLVVFLIGDPCVVRWTRFEFVDPKIGLSNETKSVNERLARDTRSKPEFIHQMLQSAMVRYCNREDVTPLLVIV